MKLQPYTSDELRFAYCCHVYYRWHTHCRRSLASLRDVAKEDLEAEHPDIHVLNIEASDVDVSLLVSIRPSESVAGAASKLKGATSKTLRRRMKLDRPQKLLGGGYFACTAGANTSEEVDRYLEKQSEHHGYDRHANPPVWVRTWLSDELDDKALQASHSATRLRWHLVLSTWNRKGTFTRAAAQAITGCWESLAKQQRVRFIKVSWAPDHVHLAIRSHPSVVPAKLASVLLNASQDVMAAKFDALLIRTGNRRIWKPGAYVGAYGNLTNRQIQAYLRSWAKKNGVV